MSGFPQGLNVGRLEDKRVGGYAVIGEQSSQDACHCQRVQRPSQSQNITLPLYSPPLKGGEYQTVTLNSFQGLLCREPEVKKSGGQAVIGGQSPQDICHCEGVKRPWQSQNSEVSLIIQPHPSPLLSKEREQESVLSPRERGNNINSPKRTYSPKLVSLFTHHCSLKKKFAFTLAEGATRVALSNSQRRAAFTLAEVLITLGIIGVVAAMTIPALMTKYQHKVRETEFKKAYSALQHALYSIDPDYISAWTSNAGDRDTEFYTELYSKYRVISDENVINLYKNKKNQFAIKNYNKKEGSYNLCASLPTRIATDGSAISGCYNCYANWIVIDTNGPKRAPNALGHDIFYFLFNQNKLIPVGSPDYSRYHWEMKPNSTYCSKNSDNATNGASCAYFAVANICPDDETKTYWECLP